MLSEYEAWCPVRNERLARMEVKSLQAPARPVSDEAASRVLAMPRREMEPCTWVLGDAEGRQKLLWAMQVRCRKQKRSAEKGARVLDAQLGWAAVCADAELYGHGGRKQMQLRDGDAASASPLDAMAEAEEQAWKAEALRLELQALSPRQREALELKAEGLGQVEAAAQMGCSQQAVAKLQKKAVAALKAALA
jgi:RNA polymerase sigma factor (sigma-70 family)